MVKVKHKIATEKGFDEWAHKAKERPPGFEARLYGLRDLDR